MTTDHTSFSFSLPSAVADEAPAAGDYLTASFRMDLPEGAAKEGDAVDDDSSDDSDFAFAVGDSDELSSADADEIFFGGRMLPVYPIFNRDLLPDPTTEEDAEAAEQIPIRQLLLRDPAPPLTSSTKAPEAAGEFCAWTPNDCRKSASTGSSRRWRLRDLMMGRSHSDGKEKFVFLEAEPPAPTRPAAKEKKASAGASPARTEPRKAAKKVMRVAEMDMATAHRLFYAKGSGSDQAVKGPQRSFLPYRQELFGLFAPMNTLQRTPRPPF
ncbi:uncharacterized protein LOC122021506 [Zingiber officinale]|uniref:Uncharacterized protein n=1 Tax=Zingiber officinale TaxID=94328 RepID=A0A8J5K867_ZINOF|nr:uncharacterized protein LOC122021506 [Zingiber officinale]KAG6477925.1 hypothetical protein ZIOFF_061357 [Zingiber officinale]